MTDQTDPELKAAAIVSFTMARALLGIIQQKGVLTPSEIDHLVEGMQTIVETILPPNDPATRPARELLQTIADEMRESGRNLPK